MNLASDLATPEVLKRRASDLLAAGRPGAARPLIAAIRRMAPPSADLAHLAARLCMCEGRLGDAAAELDGAIASEPGVADLHKLRAELRLRCEDLPGAAADAAEAVVLDAADPRAKALLGVVLLQGGQATDATTCLAEAVRAEPANPAFVQGLAAAWEGRGDLGAACAVLAEGIEACPGVVPLRNNLMLLRLRQGECESALAEAEAARRAGVADACTWGLAGHASSTMGRNEEAAESYREALKLAPDDPYVRHLVAASGAVPSALRAPEHYLRVVFNGYAELFDTHLMALGYRVPGLIRSALLRHRPDLGQGAAVGPVLDLGCGTGLMAVACSDLPLGPWEGVDVSTAMLAEAKGKGCYAALHEADLLPWLGAADRQWPVILAGDVFCYFGALEEAFALTRARLAADGLFMLSFEELSDNADAASGAAGGWMLGSLGRYAHQLGYVEAAARAAGLRVCEINRETLRREGGAPVHGLIAVLAPAP